MSLIRASIPPASVQEGPAAIVLSGGGARGGYEAGVLRYLFGDFAKKHGIPQFQIVSGTSVGAINGAYLASVLDDPVPGVQRLTQLWSELELERVIGFGMLQATRLPRVLLGGQKGGGIFDVTPLTKIVGENMRWAQLARNIRRGVLRALTISATHVATGRPWCFVDRAPDVPLPTGMPPTMVVRADRIGPQHVLASAAIPVMFPPVPVHGDLFVDGGLRLNTPMSPAVHMGARRLLVIGLTNAPHAPAVPAFEPGIFPGVAFLLGKVLNAFLLDHVNADFLELERWNRTLDDGMRIYGPDFVDRLAQAAVERGAPPRYRLHAMAIHPSSDIGRLASRHMRNHEARFGKLLGRGLLRLLDLGEGADADLVSYLLFDGEFAKQLMDLGEHDARQREAELVRFFRGTASSAGIVIPPEREPA